MRRLTKSIKSYSKSKNLLAAPSTFSKGIDQFAYGISPYILTRGKGAYVWDIDNNKYIDTIMSLGAVILGHSNEQFNNHLIKQLKKGTTLSLTTELEIELAELIVKRIPCAEMVRFGKNGNDATTLAVRLARHVTKNNNILFCGYHGWQDWYISSTSRNKGIPLEVRNLTKKFDYNNIESLENIFKQHKDDVACVIIEPMNKFFPKDNFLEKVKDITHKNGSLLIFDEMITGFRFKIGGASEYFRVTPDLATFGKSMANGYPISAICGKAKYMKMFEEVFFSFTFGGELVSMAAAIATINKIQKCNVIDEIANKGKKIREGVQKIIDKNNLHNHFSITGHPSWLFLDFKPNNGYSESEIKTLFLQEIFQCGIITLGTHNLMLAHSSKDINFLINAYKKVLPKIARVIDSKELTKHLKCAPIEMLFKVR